MVSDAARFHDGGLGEPEQDACSEQGCAAKDQIAALRAAGFNVVGADYVHLMLRESQRRHGWDAKVGLARADAEFLPFSDSSFDHVVCLGVLEYLQSYDRSIAEVRRVLRSGGSAVFALPSRVSLYALSYAAEQATLAPLWRAAKRALGKALERHGTSASSESLRSSAVSGAT